MNSRPVVYYVGALLGQKSEVALASHCQREKVFPLSPFHCTVMYSFTWFTYKAADSQLPTVIEPPFSTTMFGSICVLLLPPTAVLALRHQQLIASGAKFTYPIYQPHISLCRKALIRPPNFPITLASEYFGTWRE